MIRDITIGQYFPGKSAIHKMDPRIKILLSILYIVMLFGACCWACCSASRPILSAVFPFR